MKRKRSITGKLINVRRSPFFIITLLAVALKVAVGFLHCNLVLTQRGVILLSWR